MFLLSYVGLKIEFWRHFSWDTVYCTYFDRTCSPTTFSSTTCTESDRLQGVCPQARRKSTGNSRGECPGKMTNSRKFWRLLATDKRTELPRSKTVADASRDAVRLLRHD